MADPEQRARDFYNAGGGSYPAVTPAPAPSTWPAPGLVPPATGAAAAVETAAAAAPATPQPASPEPPLSFEERAEAMYGEPTQGLVNWDEPPARADEYQLQAPHGVLDTSDEGKAVLVRLREGFAEAGAGATLAAELFNDAVRVTQGFTSPVSQASAEADLRQYWGPRYEAKVRAACEVVQRAAQRCPEIIPFLERTGLGNDPAFIRKVAAAAVRRSRGGAR